MRKFLITAALLFLILPIFLLAQDAPALDLAKVEVILLTGIGGLGVSAITELVKRWFKAKGGAAYLISFAVSAVATAFYVMQTGWNWMEFIIYTGLVFAAANGFYKVAAKAARGD